MREARTNRDMRPSVYITHIMHGLWHWLQRCTRRLVAVLKSAARGRIFDEQITESLTSSHRISDE